MRSKVLMSVVLMFQMYALSGCGGGGGGGATTPATAVGPNNPVFISAYSVTGTSPAVNNVVPINPGVNGGQFSASWRVTGNQTYSVRIYVSEDATQDVGDIELVTGSCGKVHATDVCHPDGTVDCTFNNMNVMSCSDALGAFPVRDLSVFLASGIPKNGYLIIKACNPVLTSCPVDNVSVQIQ